MLQCDYETRELLQMCPQCDRRLRTSSQVRRLGWVLVVLGTFLTAFMGWITILVVGVMYPGDKPATTTRFTGTPQQAMGILAVFGLVIAMGLSSVAAGTWQVIYGKRNKKLAFLVLALGLVFVVMGIFAWLRTRGWQV